MFSLISKNPPKQHSTFKFGGPQVKLNPMKLIPWPTIFKWGSPQWRDPNSLSTLYSDSGIPWVASTYISLCPERTWGLQPHLFLGLQSHFFILTHFPGLLSDVSHLPSSLMFPRSHVKTASTHLFRNDSSLVCDLTSPPKKSRSKSHQNFTGYPPRKVKNKEDGMFMKEGFSPFEKLNTKQHINRIEYGGCPNSPVNSLLIFQMWEIFCPSCLGKYKPRQITIFLQTEMCCFLEKSVVKA